MYVLNALIYISIAVLPVAILVPTVAVVMVVILIAVVCIRRSVKFLLVDSNVFMDKIFLTLQGKGKMQCCLVF